MSNQKLFKIIDLASYVLLALTAVAIPLYMDKNLLNFYIIPKQYVFIGLVLMSMLLFAVKAVLSKKILIRRSILDLPILLILLISLITSIFSVNRYDSFFGRGEYFILNFVFLAICALFYFLLVNYLDTVKKWRIMLDTVLGIGGLTALIFILKMVFKVDVLGHWFPSVWNSVDKLNSLFGLWMVVMFVVSAGQIVRKYLSAGKSLFYFFITVLSFTTLVLLSFNVLWWMSLVGLVLVLLLGASFVKDARLGWLSVIFALLILNIVFITFGTPKSLQSAVPAEVALGVKPSWTITSNTLSSGIKSFLIGSGLGSFGVDFSKYRPESFNYDNTAWSLRFGQPFNTFFALLAEGGIALAIVLIFLVLFVLGHVFQIWFKTRGESTFQNMNSGFDLDAPDMRMDVFLAVVGWIVLTIGMAVIFYGPTLWWMWWLFLGLAVSGLSFTNNKIVKEIEWTVEDTPQYSLSFSFVMIVIMAAVVMVGVWGVRLYMAEVAYASALKSSDTATAEAEMKKALGRRSNSDVYHAAIAQVYLMEAVNKSKEAKPDIQAISSLMAMAVNEAKAATDLSPMSVSLWENLATMYENAAVLVPESRTWAIKSLIQAKDLEPSNPVLLWRLGNNYMLANQIDDAIKSYEQAITLKKDYIGAYIGLATAYEQNKKIDEAIQTYQQALPYAQSNVEVLFNYGRLLFNRGKGDDKAMAEKLWLEAIRIQPNYSNALYSLGLFYENKGERATALQYYYKVKDLNPDNKDVATKIRNLVGSSK